MWLDPRIQGRLRELLEASADVAKVDLSRALELAKAALEYAQHSGNKYEIAVASLSVAVKDFSLGNKNEAFSRLSQIEQYAADEKELALLAEVYVKRGDYSDFMEDLEKAETDLRAALQLSEAHDIPDSVFINACNILSFVYTKRIRYSEAMRLLLLAKDRLENPLDDFPDRSDAINLTMHNYVNIAAILAEIKDYAGARAYYEKCLELAIQEKQGRYTISLMYNNIGVIYSREGDIDKAIEYYHKSLELNKEDPYLVYQISTLGDLSEAYMKLGDFDSAEHYNDAAYECSTREGNNYYLEYILYYKGMIKFGRNDQSGISYLLEALALMDKNNSKWTCTDILPEIVKYYQSIGDYKNAFDYQQRLIHLIQEKSDEGKESIAYLDNSLRTKERLLQEKDKELLRLEVEKKDLKLQHQERELTLTTSQLASQVDLLSHFRNDLREIVRGIGDPIDALRSIKQKLKELPCEQIDWGKFEADFVSVHPEFRSLLAERFPNLTAQEVKMCLLVRLGLKNAEIARLTCLSERTVDNHRFNLRKKLGLKTEQNLTQFLATIK